MSRVQISSLTPVVTPIRTEVVLDHKCLCGSFSLPENDFIEFSPANMLAYLKFLQKYSTATPRTYWCEFPYYTVINNFKQHLCFGFRPEDLSHIETIEQKAWKKHKAHLNRLESFPLDKAEYYLRLKEAHGVSTVRCLSKITGEDWSYIAKVLRILSLPESIKVYLRNNKNDQSIVRFFTLRKLIDIVQQGDEVLQIAKFNQFMQELGVNA